MHTYEEISEFLSYNKDTGIFTWIKRLSIRAPVGSEAGSKAVNGYYKIGFKGKEYYNHRLAWLFVYKKWPDIEIDHINRNRSDNRIVNLRESTVKFNRTNTKIRTDNTSGVKGVYFDKSRNKWCVSINRFKFGRFDSFDEAVRVRKNKEILFEEHLIASQTGSIDI